MCGGACAALLPKDLATAEELFDQWTEKAAVRSPQCETYKTFWSVHPPFKLGAQYIFDKADEAVAKLKTPPDKDGYIGIQSRWFDYDPTAAAPNDPTAQGAPYVSPFPFFSGGQPQQKFKFLTFTESAELAYADELPALIEDLIDPGAFSAIYGASNAGKTFLALDMAYHIATGRAYAGKAVMQGVAVYVALEGGRRFHRRIAALHRTYGDAGDNMHVLVSKIDMRNPGADVQPLIEQLQEIEARIGKKIVFLVIDTLARSLAGGDENSSVDMGNVVTNADRLRERVELHLCYVHHTGKDKARGMRGHSNLLGAVDTEMETVATSATTGTLTATKQRDMDNTFTAEFVRENVLLGVSEKTKKPFYSCVVRLKLVAAKKADGRGRPAEREQPIFDALKQFPEGASLLDLAIFFQVDDDKDDKKNLRRALGRMRDKGLIERDDKKGRWSLPVSNVFD